MSYRRLTVCLAASAALALTTAAAATSAAGATSHSISASAPAGLHPNVVSDYLAGYTTTQIGIGRASASFTVPTLSCPTADTQGTALGIGNEPTSGSPTLLSIVFLACVSGGPQLTTQVTAGGAANFGSANAGDRIKVLMTQTSTKVTATLTDVTQAVTIKASGPPVPDNTVTFGSFPLFAGGLLPVANFGSVLVSAPYLENTKLSAWSPTKLVRKSGATLQVNAGNFLAAGGFKLTFVAN
jgi:hypothetical protein